MARILQVCNTDFYLRKFLGPLVRALVARGHEVTCVCECASEPPDVGAKVIPLDFPRSASIRGFAASIDGLRRIIRDGNYDVVNGHNRNASVVARIAAWREKSPVNLYTAHGFYFHDDQKRAPREATIALEAALARITDFTLSQSTEDADMMVRRRLIAKDRIEVIGNGIDTRRFVPLADASVEGRRKVESELKLLHDRFRIVTVGRVVRGKGFGDLLRAFARAFPGDRDDVELVLVGGNIAQDISPYALEFRAEAERLGVLDRIRTTGLVDDVERWLSVSDVFVLPSYREGLPRALLEGMSTGLAAVATNIRGCREIVVDGANGLLYEPHDDAALARILTRLFEGGALRSKLAMEARRRVVEAFDERDYVDRQVGAIERLIEPKVQS